MQEIAPASSAPHPFSRLGALGDILVVLALAAAVIALRSLHALGGGLIDRFLIIASVPLLCVAATAMLRRRGETWASLGFARPTSFWRVAALVIGGYLTMTAIAFGLVSWVLPAFGLAYNPAGSFTALRGNAGEYVYWLVVAWSSAAFGEELLFRGFVLSRFERILAGLPWAAGAAVLGQAILFGFAHRSQNAGGVLLTGGAGLVLGGVYLAGRRNLVACFILHGLIDTISLTAIFVGAAG